MIDPSTTKYLIRAKIGTEGIVEKPDVVGAIFGQTEGLLGEELDLRDLQKSGRLGRIEVEIDAKKGKVEGYVIIPSSLDQVETAILAAALETIDRVGPCKAKIEIENIEDVRITKRARIIERARQLLAKMIEDAKSTTVDITESVKTVVQTEEIITYGKDKLPAGPNIDNSDSVIIVEGRRDVLNLLAAGIKNAIAVEGTSVPQTVIELSKNKHATAFVDGDRGGELILKELLQVCEIDFIARAPRGEEVEELSPKQIMKCLRNKIPVQQYLEMYGLTGVPNVEEQKSQSFPHEREPKPEPNPPAFSQQSEQQNPASPPSQQENPKPLMQKDEPQEQKTAQNQSVQPVEGFGKYKQMYMQIAGTSKARFVNQKDIIVKEIPVRDIIEVLRNPPQGLKAVIFDGIISQRVLDLSEANGVKIVIGTKMGNVTKVPHGMSIYTRNDLD
ncbi:MAG: DNA primase DnaG [Thermoplasmata archaeon]|nr:DNA primase DnaG [Thermoplasmata archaeon]